MDKFYEQFIFTKKKPASVIYNILFYVTGFFAFIFLTGAVGLLSIKLFIGAALLGLACYGIFRLKEDGYKEFEYIFTNGNLEIDAIINKKKRKKIFDEDVKNFEDFGHADQINIKNDYKKIVCIPWDDTNEQYVILASGNKGKAAYFIAPDESMQKLIQSYFLRRPIR